MDDGSEMQWVSNLCHMNGASEDDALLISTWNDASAGCWNDQPISNNGVLYICEKND